MPLRLAIEAVNRFIAAVGGRSLLFSPLNASLGSILSPAAAPSVSLPMMRRATALTASIAPIISCLPVTTSSSRHSNSAVTPGSTKAGSACFSTLNSASPRSVGAMFFPCAARKPCFFSPAMISARVAGVPIPLASFRRPRRASSSTKRQAFCIASISVPSL